MPIDLVFVPPPESELPVKSGMEYFFHLKERLVCVHLQSTLADAGVKQWHAYDVRVQGRDSGAGELVWVFCPARKKGLSPKLMPQWVGLCTVLEKLSEVVYRVRLARQS